MLGYLYYKISYILINRFLDTFVIVSVIAFIIHAILANRLQCVWKKV